MIGKLTGTVDDLREDSLILDVRGVGYLVFASKPTLVSLTPSSSPISLYIETIVKEDSLTLYGFPTPLEQTWFRLLQTVQGVGARLALTLLSHFTPPTLYQIIVQENKKNLTEADGVGPKLALRLITELKDRLFKSPDLKGDGDFLAFEINSQMPSSSLHSLNALERDALSALENLGYRKESALKAVQEAYRVTVPPQDLKELIRVCLKHLSASKGANS